MLSRVKRNRAFTLLEMLVVVAIIGVLVAMLMPALKSSRQKGRAVRCKGNLKQLHTAAMSFAFETQYLPGAHGDEWFNRLIGKYGQWVEIKGWVNWLKYPAGHDPGTGAATDGANSARKPGDAPPWWGPDAWNSITNGAIWAQTGRSLKVYLCPSFAREDLSGKTGPDGKVFDKKLNPVYRSYGMNSAAHWIHLPNLRDASRRLMFADIQHERMFEGTTVCDMALKDTPFATRRQTNQSFGSPIQNAWDGVLSGTQAGSAKNPVEAIGTYHEGRGHGIFVDGHIETLQWSDTARACAAQW